MKWALNAIKKNFVKLPVFPVLRSKVQTFVRLYKYLCRRASARLQLLEALLQSNKHTAQNCFDLNTLKTKLQLHLCLKMEV